MQNHEEALNGRPQEGGLPDGLFKGRAPPKLHQDISTCKLILSTDEDESTSAIGPR